MGTKIRRRSSTFLSDIFRRAIDDDEEGDVIDESRLSIRRSSTPCLERRRLSSRRKSIPAYLGYGPGKSRRSSSEECFSMFATVKKSRSEDELTDVAAHLFPAPKDLLRRSSVPAKRLSEQQKQQLRLYWRLPGLSEE